MYQKKAKVQCVESAQGQFIIRNARGLHTRPSTELVKCAANFKSLVLLKIHNTTVNAKSLLGILTLAAVRGTRIRIEAEGEDAEEAVNTILELAENNFNTKY
ncbi:MAG: phosphocarrier protein HPr [Waddliaceae bacterium]|nr:phosphocarrier protein HPr [Waddliaceae bacterium]